MKNNRNMTCILATALCNQPKACASELGDDQSRYLSNNTLGDWLLGTIHILSCLAPRG